MLSGIKLVKGMKDVLPEEMMAWHYAESQLKSIFEAYGYQELRMPILEQTELFKRAIGDVTDIVEKEMYTFIDKGNEQLTLRPEGTAQAVRVMLENGMLRNQSQRIWYQGPMFRRENPQKGRYRQFYQFGVEAFGLEGPDVDAEQILMLHRLWQRVGLQDKIELEINSLGTADERKQYRQALIDYFSNCKLDEDSQRRLHTNPMRILDSKNPEMKAVNEKAPNLLDYLGEASLSHFEMLQSLLSAQGVKFKVNPRIVRGLDYYTNTVYEWITPDAALGTQNTVCGGGRFNGLVEQMGGQPTPAVGFALGVERLIMLLVEHNKIPKTTLCDVYVIADAKHTNELFKVCEQLRHALPDLRVLMNCNGGSFKSQFKRADKSGATFAVILGDDEVVQNKITIKSLRRDDLPQQTLELNEGIKFIFENFPQKTPICFEMMDPHFRGDDKGTSR